MKNSTEVSKILLNCEGLVFYRNHNKTKATAAKVWPTRRLLSEDLLRSGVEQIWRKIRGPDGPYNLNVNKQHGFI